MEAAKQIYPGVVVDPQVVHGKPVLAGTRIPVALVLGQLAAGVDFEELDHDEQATARLIAEGNERVRRYVAAKDDEERDGMRAEMWAVVLTVSARAALVAPTVFSTGAAEAGAALATVLVMARTRNVLLTILVGVSVVWGLRMLQADLR